MARQSATQHLAVLEAANLVSSVRRGRQKPERVWEALTDADIVRLTVTHENLADDAERAAAGDGWAAVLSNLKSLIETGHALPRAPWEMSRG